MKTYSENFLPMPSGMIRRLAAPFAKYILAAIVTPCILVYMASLSSLFGEGPESSLTRRIREYWNAKSTKDYPLAYSMESPQFCKEFSVEKYIKLNQNTMLNITGVDIQNTVVEGNEGRADVILHVTINQGDSPLSVTMPSRTDRWEYIGGTWYRKYSPPDLLIPIKQMIVPEGSRQD